MTNEMDFQFVDAEEVRGDLRLGLVGPSGSGKTYTALRVAQELARSRGGEVGVIDTEHGSAAKYARQFKFKHLDLTTYAPETYVRALHAAARAGLAVVVIDSLSHAWVGQEGALEQLDAAAARRQGNRFAAWADVTPMHRRLVDAMLAYPGHLIATMRAKTEWVVDQDSRGKSTPRKIGTSPVQREGMEYEFDVVGDVDADHNLVITKSRCVEVDARVFPKAGEDFAAELIAWLERGKDIERRRVFDPDLLLEDVGRDFRAAGLDPRADLARVIERPNRARILAWLELHNFDVGALVTAAREAIAAEILATDAGDDDDDKPAEPTPIRRPDPDPDPEPTPEPEPAPSNGPAPEPEAPATGPVPADEHGEPVPPAARPPVPRPGGAVDNFLKARQAEREGAAATADTGAEQGGPRC